MRARGYLTPLVMVAGGVRFIAPPATPADVAFVAGVQRTRRQDEFGLWVMDMSPEQQKRYWALTAPIGAQG